MVGHQKCKDFVLSGSTHWRHGMHTKFQSENLEGGDHSEAPHIGGKIILECILGKQGVGKCGPNATCAG